MRTAKVVSRGGRDCPYNGEEHQVVLADGRAVSIKRQTYPLTANIMKP